MNLQFVVIAKGERNAGNTSQRRAHSMESPVF